MGYYYEEERPKGNGSPKTGCLDVLVITRLVMALLMWPLLGLMSVVLGIGAALYLVTVHPLLGLIPVGVGVVVVYLVSRWDQRRTLPPDSREP